MRVLVVDNYDSFTYNLVQLIARISGVEPHVVLNDAESWDAVTERAFDAIVISPGPGRADRPKDFGIAADAIKDGRYPVLGVCLGLQGIAHHFGAKIVPAPEPMHGRLSEILHHGDGLFAGLPTPFQAVRYHSFVVEDLPAELEVTASTSDGLVMGLAHKTRPLWGVQFHPESVSTEYGDGIVRNFLNLAAQHRRAERIAPREQSVAPKRRSATSPLRVFTRELANVPDAETAFTVLYGQSAKAFWLDSSAVIEGRSRFSFMGDDAGPRAETLSYDVATHRISRHWMGRDEVLDGAIFDYLQRRLTDVGDPASALPFPFVGGFVGYLGYEVKADTGGEHAHQSRHPDSQLIFADRFVAFDHLANRGWLVCLDAPSDQARAESWFDETERKLRQCGERAPSADLPARVDTNGVFTLRHDRDEYLELINDAMREIIDGESYEVCLTNQSRGRIDLDPLTAYCALRKVNPAPYAALVRFGGLSVLCCSPERFVQISADGYVEAKPIKGTIKRSADPAEDARLRETLSASEKDRAENLMIVDLIRNDLGRTCETGSISVPRLCHIESYANVHQMVSTVVGQLSAQHSAIDCVRNMFPGGSMTGAPKRRTMQIIDRLEAGPRGVYSGAIGYFSLNGAADLNIVIRTAVIEDNVVTIGAGGAIVALSDPSSEFEEAMLKSQLIRDTLCRVAASLTAGDADE